MTNDVHSRIARVRELDAKAGAIERLWPHMTDAEDFDGQREALRAMDAITPGLADLAVALAGDAEKMLGLLRRARQVAIVNGNLVFATEITDAIGEQE